MTECTLFPLRSWQEFVEAAQAPPTIRHGAGREEGDDWCGASWEEALRMAVDGWHVPLLETAAAVAELGTRSGLGVGSSLEPSRDVTGSEVDVGAYLAGEPECMVDAVPRQTSHRGRVVTFLVPAVYSHFVPHDVIVNRGIALATLSAAIVRAGHSVELWSGFAAQLNVLWESRCSAVAKVISAGEAFDAGRLVFALAHPAMLRRLWFSVWDSQDAAIARALNSSHYGSPPFSCTVEDLPPEIEDAYVLPYLDTDMQRWKTLERSLSWCEQTFAELGLVRQPGSHIHSGHTA
ncbi:DUF7192 family protein [Saccharopolyspora dendranthemae]|uniref:DUF7192 domain-containing protein n=1 Tax=Saccharopolyspora dendranthemae TaxID=1181886 RepID=A0A561V7V1_9PSEU|nr:hypothetical protein [Saccharopolyspora dendranthemae]TWG07670.1 hypothetical protein FHU35_11287 [Saccharopolyspora dendranthemae]